MCLEHDSSADTEHTPEKNHQNYHFSMNKPALPSDLFSLYLLLVKEHTKDKSESDPSGQESPTPQPLTPAPPHPRVPVRSSPPPSSFQLCQQAGFAVS